MKRKHFILLLLLLLLSSSSTVKWGFFAHQKINRLAIFTLPPEMIPFYKKNITYLTEHAVDPDKRRHNIKEEAACHYIDIDEHGDSALFKLPRYWKQAVEKYPEDTLRAYGIVPWHIMHVKAMLTNAFKEHNASRILKLSADLGHYIADANVPLHTTKNYNGQLTGQEGIHAFWESRLPEMFFNDYDFFSGHATYLEKPQLEAWKAIETAHNALDSVLLFEKELSKKFNEDKKYVFEERNGILTKTYSRAFSKIYHNKLNGQVEKRMRASIKMVGDFWYTCWVDAGQPDLNNLEIRIENKKDSISTHIPVIRDHDF